MKSWDLTNNIIKKFYPALTPSCSYILHQDFAHWFTPWIHLTQYRFRNYLEFVYEVPRSSSVVFKLCRPIPSELIRNTYSFSSFTIDEIESAFNYSFSLVSKRKHPDIAAAKVMTFIHLGDFTRAEQELEKYRIQGLTFSSDLSKVEKRLSDSSLAQQLKVQN